MAHLSSGLVTLGAGDAVGMSGGFSDGLFCTPLISSPLDKEAMGMSGGFNNGTLQVVLVTNAMQTEAFGLSAGFNNGTLMSIALKFGFAGRFDLVARKVAMGEDGSPLLDGGNNVLTGKAVWHLLKT